MCFSNSIQRTSLDVSNAPVIPVNGHVGVHTVFQTLFREPGIGITTSDRRNRHGYRTNRLRRDQLVSQDNTGNSAWTSNGHSADMGFLIMYPKRGGPHMSVSAARAVVRRKSPDLPCDRFGLAYTISLVASLTSAGLTYIYVGGGLATEVNPVLALVIEQLGLEAMVLVKAGIVMGAYRALRWIGVATSTERAAVLFAWIGSGINSLNAVYDISTVAFAGFPTVETSGLAFVLLLGGLLVGLITGPFEQ